MSRLYTILRENNGLTYTSRVIATEYEHSGHIMFYAITDSTKILNNGKVARNKTHKKGRTHMKKGVYPLMLDLLANLVKHGVTEKEVSRTKTYLDGKRMMNLENPHTQVENNGISMLLYNSEDTVPYKEGFNTYYKPITRERINQVIAKYFKPENMNIAMVGGNLPDVNLVKRMAMEMW